MIWTREGIESQRNAAAHEEAFRHNPLWGTVATLCNDWLEQDAEIEAAIALAEKKDEPKGGSR